jgi:riboflavin kinase/FMN adenylyltransferase
VRVAIIGNFDGVHGGHRTLLDRARERAAADAGGRVIAVTFDPHPAAVLRPDRTPGALMTLDRRTELLLQAGADEVVVLAFTPELAALAPAAVGAGLGAPVGRGGGGGDPQSRRRR